MGERFTDEATYSLLPKEIFPLWWDKVHDLEVVKNQHRVVYRVQADGERYYLKITPDSDNCDWRPDKEKLQLSTDFALHLCSMDAPVAQPIASRHGWYVEEFTFNDVYMVMQVTAEAVGIPVSTDCTDPDVFERCGLALAKLHCAAASFPQASSYDPDSWERNWAHTGKTIPDGNRTLLSEYREIDAWLDANSPLPGGKGLSHGDTKILNFIDDTHHASLMDITEPEFRWYAIEVAGPLRSHCDESISHEGRQRLCSGFLSGYCSCRPIDMDFESITWLLRMIHLDMYVWCLNSNPENISKEYMRRWLRFIEDPSKW